MNNKKKPASIGKNFFYNTAYQMLAVLVPLLTTPYAARIFGADGVGVNSYVTSVSNVFVLFASLGVSAYGQREIAQNRDDKEKITTLFWEIELLCVLTTSICLVLWFVTSFLEATYTPYFLASTFTVLAVAFDITWFFAGLEEFRFIVLRNSVVKLIGMLFLFVAIKSQNDLLLYIGVISATGLLGNISMWTYLPRFLSKPDFKSLRIFRHLRHTIVYFIPTIASSVYTMVDKVMLRFLTEGTLENGYYEETTKIVRTAQIVLLSINTVMTSRMSYLFAHGRVEEIKRRLEKSISFILILAYPFTFGIMGIAENFVPWFFGDGFKPVVLLLRLYSPLLIIVGISNCLGTQYLTPSGQRGRSSKGIIAGAVTNVILNLFLIPKFGAAGATVASVFAELVILCVYFYMSLGYVSLSMFFKHSYTRLIASAVMLVSVLAIGLFPISGIILTVLQIGCGALVYLVMLILLQDDMVSLLYSKLTTKLKQRKSI